MSRRIVLGALMLVVFTVACHGDGVSDATKTEVMARWNAVAPATAQFDFHWTSFDQFPHPTYQGGSPAAYQTFAIALALFLQNEDNFTFLKNNGLFDLPLPYGISNAREETSFDQLALEFSRDTETEVPLGTRMTLKTISARIRGQ